MIKIRKLVKTFARIRYDAADSMFDNFEYDGTTLDKHWKTQCAKDKIYYTIASHYLGTIGGLDADASITYDDAMAPLLDMQIDGIKRLRLPEDFNLEYNSNDYNASKDLTSMIKNVYDDLYKAIKVLEQNSIAAKVSSSEVMNAMLNSGTKSS
jgi:hypothetical protein